jgi:homoserine kinase
MVTVRVPATIANFGPAFDVLGVAVTIYNTVQVDSAAAAVIDVAGQGKGTVPEDPSNLVYRAAAAVAARAGRPGAFALRCHNDIPPGRGLGSSAAAIVGGAVAANELLGRPLSRDDLLDLAWRLEGHPDNVAPALLGGAVLTDVSDGSARWTRITPAWDVRLVVAVPEFSVATARARAALPAQVPFADAVANVSRTAWLVTAMLTGQVDLLALGMDDRLHQPYRRSLVPGMEEAFAAARSAGAYGAALCGSGPSVLAVAPPARADLVGRRMVEMFAGMGHAARYLQVNVDAQGAIVVH